MFINSHVLTSICKYLQANLQVGSCIILYFILCASFFKLQIKFLKKFDSKNLLCIIIISQQIWYVVGVEQCRTKLPFEQDDRLKFVSINLCFQAQTSSKTLLFKIPYNALISDSLLLSRTLHFCNSNQNYPSKCSIRHKSRGSEFRASYGNL